MVTSKLNTNPKPSPAQSAAERKAAEAQARQIITKFAPDHLRLVTTIRNNLRKRLPTACEIIYEYRSWFVFSVSPSEHGHEGVLAIRGDKDGIKLYFSRGKELPDPEKLLKGSAQVRFIEVTSPSTLTRPAVATLIDEAIAHNKAPFPSAGQGSVILSASTKKLKKKAGTPKSRK